MTNGTKILIGIIVVVAITTGIIVGIGTSKSKQTSTNIAQNNNSIIDEYLNSNKEENNVEENNTIENEISNEVVEEQNNTKVNETENIAKTNIINSSSSTVVGKEEQESKKENTSANAEETAIELAKKEWGINVNAYSFESERKSDEIFEVTVRNQNDRNVVTVYQVNVKTGVVTE